MKELVRRLLQELTEEERDQHVGVSSHKRDQAKRKATRNGYKKRSLNTRFGHLQLAKPQIREFAFYACLFENYQRSEKALLLAINQMVTDGVSTNRVKKIVAKISPDLTYSQSTVSRLTQELDPQIKCWREGYWHKIRTTNLIEGALNRYLKQCSKGVCIFPNRESCFRYARLRLMEIDEQWQPGKRYMSMPEEEHKSDNNEGLIREINKLKKGVKTKEELVTT